MDRDPIGRSNGLRAVRVLIAIAAVAAVALTVSACGGSDSTTGGGGETTGGGDTTAATGGEKTVPKIAYFQAAKANTYTASTAEAIEEVATKDGGEVTVFDGNFEPATQSSQMQDALTSGKYNAFIVSSVDNTTLVPPIEEAIADGIPVGSTVTPIGPDIGSGEVQVKGQTVAVLTPAKRLGELIGVATVQACADLDPCKVVYLSGDPKVAFETVKEEEFKKQIEKKPSIELVATGAGGYLADPSRQAMQDILQTNPDVNVVASDGDQMTDGAAQAGKEAGKHFLLVGGGASEIAVKGIEEGTWYASVLNLPYTEGIVAAEGVIAALNGEKGPTGGIDPVKDAGYTEGIMTKKFLEENPDFKAQWPG